MGPFKSTKKPKSRDELVQDARKDPNSFGNVARRVGRLTGDQVEEALEVQKDNPDKNIGETLVDLGFIQEETLTNLRAVQDNLREPSSEKKYNFAVAQAKKALDLTKNMMGKMESFLQKSKEGK